MFNSSLQLLLQTYFAAEMSAQKYSDLYAKCPLLLLRFQPKLKTTEPTFFHKILQYEISPKSHQWFWSLYILRQADRKDGTTVRFWLAPTDCFGPLCDSVPRTCKPHVMFRFYTSHAIYTAQRVWANLLCFCLLKKVITPKIFKNTTTNTEVLTPRNVIIPSVFLFITLPLINMTFSKLLQNYSANVRVFACVRACVSGRTKVKFTFVAWSCSS
jgi:hypothetical protein